MHRFKTMKKLYFLIFFAAVLFLSYEIADSYAKYASSANGTLEKQAGAWVIRINNENVVASGIERTFSINSLEYPLNEYVLENKMAPSSSGYFDIVIDPTGSSTAVVYDVTLNFDELDISDSINFDSAYKVINGTETSTGLVRTGENTYSGIITLTEVKASTATRLRFYIEWEEDGTGQNDADDSVLGLSRNVTLSIPVTVVVRQYLGETLVPYV